MAEKRTVEFRELACTEPAEAVLKAVDTLAEGQYLEVIHYQEPRLIYPHLQKRGFAFLVRKGDEPAVRVLIWRQRDAAARDAVDAAVSGLL